MNQFRSESDIVAQWDNLHPLVSICCISYNQDTYIEDAIKGFLMQETTFPFEIIISDDSSTDSTSHTLIKYQKIYPRIIKVIINKYNIGMQKNLLQVMDFACGKYLAICEGDDYWIDAGKLQTQYDVIELNPDISFVAHTAIVLENNIFKVWHYSFPFKNGVFLFDFKDIIEKSLQFAPTASYFFKREVCDVLPSWFVVSPVGDTLLELYSLKIGSGIYLEKAMSVYRRNAINNWTSSTSRDINKKILAIQKLRDMLFKIKADFPDIPNKHYLFREQYLNEAELFTYFSNLRIKEAREIARGMSLNENSSIKIKLIIMSVKFRPLFYMLYGLYKLKQIKRYK